MSNEKVIPSEGAKQSRPDAAFKIVTALEAKNVGLVEQASELQFSTRTDLILTIPSGVSVANTLFDFFREISVVEFKSENDPFRLTEFIRNEVRASIWFLQNDVANFDQILTVYVLSRLPEKFLEEARQKNISFTSSPERTWLLQGEVGFQNVALVICRDLPLEKQYYQWLLFAPSDSRKWERFIQRLVEERQIGLLELAQQLRPEEFSMITAQEVIEKMKAERSPEEQAAHEKKVEESYAVILNALAESPEKFAKALAQLPEEKRLAILAKINALYGKP